MSKAFTDLEETIQKLTDTLNGDKFPFELILDDPSGNSFIENPYAPQTDPSIKVSYFDRTKEMIEQMGFSVENQKQEMQSGENTDNKEKKENVENKENAEKKEIKDTEKEDHVKISYYNKKKDFTVYKPKDKYSQMIVDFTEGIDDQNSDIDNKIIQFPANCYCCNAPGFLRDCVCSIPYFKEIIISCFKCDKCGYKTTSVRGGGGISEKGTKMTLSVETEEDLNRDVFKSETSKVSIPEVGFETSEGSLGSMFTTVEGVIDKICTQLLDTPFTTGDSSINNLNNFVMKLRDLKQMNKKFTFILDDPLSNSFIFPIGEEKNDKRLKKEEYERTFEQNEDLGINDMKVENYEEDAKKDEKKEEKKDEEKDEKKDEKINEK